MNCRSCLFFSVLALLLTSASSGYCQLYADTESIFLVVPEDEPQVDWAISLQNDFEDQDVRYRIRASAKDLDLENRMVRDDRGGPDEMEYEWRDSNEDDGPSYDWIDIRDLDGVIDLEANDDDSTYGPFDLGFVSTFYGHEYEEIFIGANGFVTYLRTALFPFYNNWQQLPNAQPGPDNATPPRAFLCCNFQYLDPSQGGAIYYWTDESMAVVTWEDLPHFGINGGETWTFQCIITAQGLVRYQFQNNGAYDDRPDLVIGFQNEERELGFTCAYNTSDYLEEEMAISFGPPNAWMNWMTIEPKEGAIAAGGAEEIILSIDASELDPGYYYAELVIEAEGQSDITIPVVMSWASPVGGISGHIVDAGTGDAIRGATTVLEEVALTDEGSQFGWEDLPVGLWDITITAPDYRPVSLQGVEVVAGEVTQLNIEMVYGLFRFLQDNEIEEQLAPDTDVEVAIRATNNGTAPVHYTTEPRLVGDANHEPWDLRREMDVGATVDDDRIQGVAFANDHFYIAGADGNATNKIYVVDRDGQLVDQFDQVGEAQFGMKDLASDGELIWGAGEADIFAYTLDGELAHRFRGPVQPSTFNVAWDEENGLLWCCGTTSGIQALDRDGNAVGAPLNRRGLRMYGLACFPGDPDGYTLYLLTSIDAEDGSWIYKMNPANGDTIRLHHLVARGAPLAQSLEITNSYDIYSWIVLSTTNRPPLAGGDQLWITQLEARKDWMSIAPTEGTIEAENTQAFTITLNAAGLPDADFVGEILFEHDGRGGQTVLPITMHVTSGQVQSVRQVDIMPGWNIISANLQPNNADIRSITQSLVDRGQLLLMKDGAGHFYTPSNDFNNIPDWAVAQGYQIKLTTAASLTLAGLTVMADDPIQLNRGWQLVAYYPRIPIDAVDAFAGIAENIVVVKDGNGNFYLPNHNFSNMGDLIEGRGYQINVDQAVELVYQSGDRVAGLVGHQGLIPAHFPVVVPTGSDMSLLVKTGSIEGEIGVYINGVLVGSGVIAGGLCGVAVRGDDRSTSNLDGASEGDPLSVRYWNGLEEVEAALTPTSGDGHYLTDGVAIGSLSIPETPQEFRLAGIYPNPFNSSTNVSFQMPANSLVNISLFDQSGRLAMNVMDGQFAAGLHRIGIDASTLPSGVYFVRVATESQSLKAKILLIR